jgi:isoprenylcysteine carboxyl methyltransferase (ICMT) family protein YpbQ
MLQITEEALRWIGAVAGLGTLSIALLAMVRSLRRVRGRVEAGARLILRLPILTAATIAFLAAGIWLWHPLPLRLSEWAQLVATVLGGLLLVGGCVLYLWGLRALGVMFGPSSGFGVALHAAHRLIEAGPYAFVRHPMYLAVMIAASGSLMLYRTWSTLAFAILMLGLIFRARREDRVLGDEFGEAWRDYAARVPGWIPHLRRRPNV